MPLKEMTGKVLYQVNLLSIYLSCVSFATMVVFVFGEDKHPVESSYHFGISCCMHLNLNEKISLMLNVVCEGEYVGI